MIQLTRGFLAGKKTYALSIVVIVLTWLGFALGEPVLGHDAASVGDAIEMTIMALLAMAFRAGVDNSAKKVLTTVNGGAPEAPTAPQVVDVGVVKSAMEQFVRTLERKSTDAPPAPPAPPAAASGDSPKA